MLDKAQKENGTTLGLNDDLGEGIVLAPAFLVGALAHECIVGIGHGDNAAAALHGGLTSVVDREGREPLALRWHWPEELRLIVATPAAGED